MTACSQSFVATHMTVCEPSFVATTMKIYKRSFEITTMTVYKRNFEAMMVHIRNWEKLVVSATQCIQLNSDKVTHDGWSLIVRDHSESSYTVTVYVHICSEMIVIHSVIQLWPSEHLNTQRVPKAPLSVHVRTNVYVLGGDHQMRVNTQSFPIPSLSVRKCSKIVTTQDTNFVLYY